MEGSENFYIVFDRVAGRILLSVTAPNDSIAVRNSLSTLRVPLKDSELYCIGKTEFNFSNESQSVSFGFDFKYIPTEIRRVDWSVYSFPDSPAEALSPLGPNVTFME